jgi:hypothetical protein
MSSHDINSREHIQYTIDKSHRKPLLFVLSSILTPICKKGQFIAKNNFGLAFFVYTCQHFVANNIEQHAEGQLFLARNVKTTNYVKSTLIKENYPMSIQFNFNLLLMLVECAPLKNKITIMNQINSKVLHR